MLPAWAETMIPPCPWTIALGRPRGPPRIEDPERMVEGQPFGLEGGDRRRRAEPSPSPGPGRRRCAIGRFRSRARRAPPRWAGPRGISSDRGRAVHGLAAVEDAVDGDQGPWARLAAGDPGPPASPCPGSTASRWRPGWRRPGRRRPLRVCWEDRPRRDPRAPRPGLKLQGQGGRCAGAASASSARRSGPARPRR